MKLKISNLEERLFSIGYVCVLMAFLIQISTLPNKYSFFYSAIRNLRIMGYASCILKIIIGNTFTIRNLFKFLLASLLIVIVTLRTDSILFLTDILFIIACQGIELKRIIRVDLKVRCIVLVVLVLLSVSGVIPDILDYRNGILSRHSLGFAHPNRFALHVLMICIYYFYLHYERIKIKHIAIIATMGLFAIIASDGRTSFLGIVLLVIIATIKKLEVMGGNNKFIERHARGVSVAVILVSLVFSILAPLLLLRNTRTINSNDTFAMRFLMSSRAIQENGITLFGQKIEFIGTIAARLTGKTSNAIDNGYMFVLINHGVFMLCFLIIIIVFGIRYSIRMNDYAGLICFSLLLLIGVMEGQILSIESNLFLLYIGMAWYHTTAKNEYHFGEVEVSTSGYTKSKR